MTMTTQEKIEKMLKKTEPILQAGVKMNLFSVSIFNEQDFFVCELVVAENEERALKKTCFKSELDIEEVKNGYVYYVKKVKEIDGYKIKLEKENLLENI